MSDRATRLHAHPARSLQFRLVLLISAVLVVMVAVIGAVSIAVQYDSLVRRIDEQLEISRGMVTGPDGWALLGDSPSNPQNPAEGPGSPTAAGPGAPRFGSLEMVVIAGTVVYAQAVTDEGETVSLSEGQVGTLLSSIGANVGPSTVRLGDLGSYRVLASGTSAGLAFVVGQSLQEVRQTTWNLVIVFGVTAIVGVTLASAGSGFLVRRELRPLETLRQAASAVSQTSLTSGPVTLPPRVPEPEFSRGTEVGDLSESFNQMLDHVEASLRQREASENKLKRFAADASHELRTPLAAVSGYAEFAMRQKTEVPNDVSISLGRIRSESARMAQIIEDLLLLARLDNGSTRSLGPTLVEPTLVEAITEARVIDPDRPWRAQLADSSGEWAVPLAPGDLRRVLANLLANARTHTPTGTPVLITVDSSPRGEVVIEVVDQGPGISPELLPHVFDRFVRGDSARTAAAKGESRSTGLGLSISRELVEAAGGSITARSHPGRTVFTVTLPRVAATGNG